MTRVLIHAGFHKTGTTSLQKYLAQHRAALRPHFDYYGQAEFQNAGAAARIYAQKPFIWRRKQFRRAFASFLDGIPDAEAIVLSRETFAGNMPGHRDWRGRPLRSFRKAAVPLCRDIADALRRRFGRGVEIEFLFTTRDYDSWVGSVYGHLLRSIHLTESLAEFRALLGRPIDLEAEAQQIAKALRPLPVHTARLQDLSARPEGPAAAVLDLMGVPAELRQGLPPAERHNLRQAATLEATFLDLNRSDMDRGKLRAMKAKLLRDDQA